MKKNQGEITEINEKSNLEVLFSNEGFFAINGEKSLRYNLFSMLRRTIIPFILATVILMLVIFMQASVDASCFIPRMCHCSNSNIGKKLLFFFRQIFVKWVFIVISYNIIFGYGKKNDYLVMRILHLPLNFLAFLIIM